jgi:hypothetical protein
VVAERAGEHQTTLDVGVARAGAEAEGDRHVTRQLALHGHLQPLVAGFARDRGRGAQVGERVAVRLPDLPRPGAHEQRPCQHVG